MARTLLNDAHLRMQGTSDVTQYAKTTSETSAAILAELRSLNQQLNWLCHIIGAEAARANGQVGQPGN